MRREQSRRWKTMARGRMKKKRVAGKWNLQQDKGTLHISRRRPDEGETKNYRK
uniref:Uncharacterized protein n=1 Tax=Arundo donax TaxID=35708 RepID=A0A0A9AQL7_ARUDO